MSLLALRLKFAEVFSRQMVSSSIMICPLSNSSLQSLCKSSENQSCTALNSSCETSKAVAKICDFALSSLKKILCFSLYSSGAMSRSKYSSERSCLYFCSIDIIVMFYFSEIQIKGQILPFEIFYYAPNCRK